MIDLNILSLGDGECLQKGKITSPKQQKAADREDIHIKELKYRDGVGEYYIDSN